VRLGIVMPYIYFVHFYRKLLMTLCIIFRLILMTSKDKMEYLTNKVWLLFLEKLYVPDGQKHFI